ncbi:MAG: hypothetical protein WBQ18_17555, partial [Solirubrobacteraceae bacterium]
MTGLGARETEVVRVVVHVESSGRHDELLGFADEVLSARLARSHSGAEGDVALARLVAGTLGVPESAVRIVAGPDAQQRSAEVTGLDGTIVSSRLRRRAGARASRSGPQARRVVIGGAALALAVVAVVVAGVVVLSSGTGTPSPDTTAPGTATPVSSPAHGSGSATTSHSASAPTAAQVRAARAAAQR